MQYGKYFEQNTFDDEGSTVTRETTIVNGEHTDLKKRYEVRVRVSNEKEELAEYLKFRAETKDMAKCEFRIEHTAAANDKGFYYVIKCWNEIG